MSEAHGFPRRVGRYKLLTPIASGGTATVYLASPDPLAQGDPRLVALKLPHAHLAQVGGVSTAAELVEEAKLVARIQHPHVVRITDVGIDEHGFFLVMDFVEGASVATLLSALAERGERVPLSVTHRIMDDALAGLEAAHAATDPTGRPLGLVHRDFSPQNLLVDVQGLTRLTDFGIARAATRAQFTQTGIVKGKAGYMSPEQAQGLPLDQRTDVWSAGVVLWEMLAGRPLYPGEEPLPTMMRIVNETPPRLLGVRPELPAALDHAIAAALTPDRDQRCPSVTQLRRLLTDSFRDQPPATREEVASLLRRVCDARLTAVRRETTTAIARHRRDALSRTRRRVALGVTGAAALGGLAWAGTWVSRRLPAQAHPDAGVLTAVTLATAQQFPRNVVVDDTWAYWSARGGVYRTHKSGNAWFDSLAAADDVRGLALDATHVVFAEFGADRVARVSKGGGAVQILATVTAPEGVAIDGADVFFTSNVGQIWHVPSTGGPRRLVSELPGEVAGRRVIGIALDGTHVYWADIGLRRICRAPRAGGPAETIAETGTEPYTVALDEDTLYWRDGSIGNGRLLAVPKAGGPTRVLIANGHAFPRGVAVDPSGIYWTAGSPKDGRVHRLQKDGSGLQTLARGHLGAHGITTDAEAVYFTAWGGGSVWKVQKPPTRPPDR